MSPRRLADHCDEDDPLASAVLGLWSMLDALAEELGPPEPPPGRAEPPLTSTDELELAVLGLLSVRRTTSWILASLSPLAVLSGLGSRAQRIIYVGQRLAALAANAPEAA